MKTVRSIFREDPEDVFMNELTLGQVIKLNNSHTHKVTNVTVDVFARMYGEDYKTLYSLLSGFFIDDDDSEQSSITVYDIIENTNAAVSTRAEDFVFDFPDTEDVVRRMVRELLEEGVFYDYFKEFCGSVYND